MPPRVIDEALLPDGPPPVPRPTRLRPPAPPAPVVTTAAEPVLDAGLPMVADPTGRAVSVEGRTLTEAMFFRFGFARATLAEMADGCIASVMWVARILAAEPWLAEAYKAGMTARDTESVVTAKRSLEKLVEGYTQGQEKVTKEGEVIPYEETIGPSVEAVKFQLSSRDRENYGKDAKPAPGVVPVSVLVQINQGLRDAGVAEVVVAEAGGDS